MNAGYGQTSAFPKLQDTLVLALYTGGFYQFRHVSVCALVVPVTVTTPSGIVLVCELLDTISVLPLQSGCSSSS